EHPGDFLDRGAGHEHAAENGTLGVFVVRGSAAVHGLLLGVLQVGQGAGSPRSFSIRPLPLHSGHRGEARVVAGRGGGPSPRTRLMNAPGGFLAPSVQPSKACVRAATVQPSASFAVRVSSASSRDFGTSGLPPRSTAAMTASASG